MRKNYPQDLINLTNNHILRNNSILGAKIEKKRMYNSQNEKNCLRGTKKAYPTKKPKFQKQKKYNEV